jgi:uncharacterized protein Yka (UPF0111/DUF47 family)
LAAESACVKEALLAATELGELLDELVLELELLPSNVDKFEEEVDEIVITILSGPSCRFGPIS